MTHIYSGCQGLGNLQLYPMNEGAQRSRGVPSHVSAAPQSQHCSLSKAAQSALAAFSDVG